MKNKDFIKFATKFQIEVDQTLKRVSHLLYLAGDPHKKLKFVHVAGTNGKGSVCAYLQSIFTEAGFKTGKYVSPYLLSVLESISIDNNNITQKDFDKYLLVLSDLAIQVEREIGKMPSQFEIQVAVMFLYFAEKNVDIVILETGLGGLLDATNVIDTPLLSVITKIDVDHKAYLGETLEEITTHKAGIIKGGTTVTAPQVENVMQLLSKVCEQEGSLLVEIEKPDIKHPKNMQECFSYKGMDGFVCGIPGAYQVENACIAIECALKLQLPAVHIKSGIKKAVHPARFETIYKNVLFDGAHNLNGMIALKNALDRYFPNAKINYILAFMKDKDVKEMLKVIADGNQFIFTEVKNNARCLPKEQLKEIAEKVGIKGETANVKTAIEKSAATNTLTVICGSLYLYKDVKQA